MSAIGPGEAVLTKVDPDGGSHGGEFATANRVPEDLVASAYRVTIAAIYKKHAPQELGCRPYILAGFLGRESELYLAVCSKLGIEAVVLGNSASRCGAPADSEAQSLKYGDKRSSSIETCP